MTSDEIHAKSLPDYVFMGAMLLIGTVASVLIVLYAYNFGFWFDELITWETITLDAAAFINYFAQASDLHPPLYYVILKLFLNVNPPPDYTFFYTYADFALKISGLAFYVILGVGLTIFGKKYPSTRQGVLLTFFIISSSAPTLYLFSQMRMYGLLAVLCSTILLLGAQLTVESSRRYHLLIGILMTASLMTHYIALLFCAAFIAAYMLINKPSKQLIRSIALLSIIPGVVFGLYLPIFFVHLDRGTSYTRDLNDLMTYLTVMFNSLTVLLIGFLAAIWMIWKKTTDTLPSDSITLRLCQLAGLAFAIFLGLSVGYFIVEGNSVITFSTNIILIILLAYLFGFALQYTPTIIKTGFCFLVIGCAIAPNIVGLKDSTYFESNRLSYRNIIQQADLDTLIYDLNVQTIITDADNRNYTYYIVPLVVNQYPVDVVRVSRGVILNPAQFDFVDCQGILLLTRHWQDIIPGQFQRQDINILTITKGMTYLYPLECA